MKIQNHSYASMPMAAKGKTYTGDANGVFDVPDELGEMLVNTPGWRKVATGRVPTGLPAAPLTPAKTLKAALTPPKPVTAPEKAPETTPEPSSFGDAVAAMNEASEVNDKFAADEVEGESLEDEDDSDSDEEEAEEEEASDESEARDYESMTVPQLKAEALDRKVALTGTVKADIIKDLRAADLADKEG